MSGWEPEVGSGGTRYAVQSGMAHIWCPGLENRHDLKTREKKSKPKAGLSGNDHF